MGKNSFLIKWSWDNCLFISESGTLPHTTHENEFKMDQSPSCFSQWLEPCLLSKRSQVRFWSRAVAGPVPGPGRAQAGGNQLLHLSRINVSLCLPPFHSLGKKNKWGKKFLRWRLIKRIKDINIRLKIIKLLEENTDLILYDLGFDNSFLDMIPKALYNQWG